MSLRNISPDQSVREASDDYIISLIQYFEAEEHAVAALVSRTWCTRFTTPASWKKMFQSMSGVPIELMNEFELDVFDRQNGLRVDWRVMCKNLEASKKNLRRVNTGYLRILYQSPSHYLVLLTLCLNNEAYASQALISKDDAFGWYCLSLYGNLNNIVRSLGRRFSLNSDGYCHAIWAGNLEMVKELYVDLAIKEITPIEFQNAISSGNVRLVEWMLQINPKLTTDDVFSMGGNPEMMRWVIDQKIKVKTRTSDACWSGEIFPVDYFCALTKQELYEHDLPFVIAGGNQRLVELLLARFECAIRPDYLVRAHESGNFLLFKFLFTRAYPNFVRDRVALTDKASDVNSNESDRALARKELTEANQAIDDVEWSGKIEFIKFYRETLGMPITKKVFLNVLRSADDFTFDYIRANSAISLRDVSVRLSQMIRLISNRSLGRALRFCEKLQSLFDEEQKESVQVERQHPPYIFAALDMLLHPKWYDLDERKMGILLLELEDQLPKQKPAFALIERHKTKTMLNRLVNSDIYKCHPDFAKRIDQLQALFVTRDALKNASLLA
jgi:hypothetical protein